MIVVTGATGHIGSKLARILRDRKAPLRLVGRDAGRLKPLTGADANAFIGDLTDPSFLRKAFMGADGVFAMVPPAYGEADQRGYQNRVGEALAAAVAQAGVRRVVALSSQGADRSEKTGPILGLHDLEARLKRLEGAEVAVLRPTFFMENLLAGIPLVKGPGFNGSPLRADLAIPMIATQDIAEAAARLLLAPAAVPPLMDLLGPRDYTMTEATAVLGRAIGKPDLAYVQIPYEDALQAMTRMGVHPDAAGRMMEMERSINEGTLLRGTARTAANTTPTTLEAFAPVFAAAFAA